MPFSKLRSADLVVNSVYEGGLSTNFSAEVISKLVGVGIAGGFRYVGSAEDTPLAVLFTTGKDLDWPDVIDANTGILTYFGDNKSAGVNLLERKGNRVLKAAFDKALGDQSTRQKCPIFLVFTSIGEGYSVEFKGLAVPGGKHADLQSGLEIVWHKGSEHSFQNYKSTFTILNETCINGDWIREIAKTKSVNMKDHRIPPSLQKWIETGEYLPLCSESS